MKDGALAEEEEKQSGVGGGSKKIKRGVRRPRHRRMPESMHITGEEKQRPCITSIIHATLMLFLGSPAEATSLSTRLKLRVRKMTVSVCRTRCPADKIIS